MIANTKAIGYIRVSSDEQAREGLSLEAQKRKIAAYCDIKGLELVDIYSDEAVSGFTPFDKRPGGNKAYSALFAGQASHLVAIKLDRCFRNTGDAIQKATEFDKHNINLHLIETSVDTSTAVGKMFFTTLAMLAQFERDITGERTKAVLDMKKQDSKAWNHELYGVSRKGDDFIVNKSEQDCITQILSMRDAGLSYGSIASQLDSMGIKPKLASRWNAMSIRKICLRSNPDRQN